MIKILNDKQLILHQGDIIKDVELVENVIEQDCNITVSKIVFPYIIVLTQDCDLTWDYNNRNSEKNNQDKYLISTIVAPLYNYDKFLIGEQLLGIKRKMQVYGIKENSVTKIIKQNNNPRYHYLEFPVDIDIVNSIIDFKHYFSVGTEYLYSIYKDNFTCRVDILYRELISQRFANFLSRIGLPEEKQ
ncbi:MAG: hypothetical protein GX121_04400 [Ignavibacteria bacterium]|nr:hypothetical protein [Ignavibacteria bacterium]